MDPVSIIGLTTGCLGLAHRAGSLARDLYTLQTRYSTVQYSIRSVSSQVSAIKTISKHLAARLDSTFDARGDEAAQDEEEDLLSTLRDVLEACDPLIILIQEQVSKVRCGKRTLGIRAKTSYLWNEQLVSHYGQLLQGQVQALSALLQCMQMPVPIDRQCHLSDAVNQQFYSRVKEDAASILCLRDADTCRTTNSVLSDTSSALNIQFTFDDEIMSSWAYRGAFTYLMRFKTSNKRRDQKLTSFVDPTPDDFSVTSIPTLQLESDVESSHGGSDAEPDSNPDLARTPPNPKLLEQSHQSPPSQEPRRTNFSEGEETAIKFTQSLTTSLLAAEHRAKATLEADQSAKRARQASRRVLRVTFSPAPQILDTWPASEYDRLGIKDIACQRLTPTLADEIKREICQIKCSLEFHEDSHVFTHCFDTACSNGHIYNDRKYSL